MWLHSSNINCIHGFSIRHGGVSPAPYNSLNLGGNEDLSENIRENRFRALKELSLNPDLICNLKQVHGANVCNADYIQQEGDALVTNEKNKCLAISIADCYPILFYDEANHIIGAAHAGWRGTVNRIAENTFLAMKKLGANARTTKVAIGQGICREHFVVGEEVVKEFLEKGFKKDFIHNNKIDLIACNKRVLTDAGIAEKNIWVMNRCTYQSDFFSYRRDGGKTGRMWALICMKE